MNWESVLDWTREYYQRLHALRSEDFAFWADYVVFTWRWWVKVAMLRWTYAYSFPILFGMYLAASLMAAGDRFEAIE